MARSCEGDLRQEFTERWLTTEPALSAFIHSAVPVLHDFEDLVQQVALELATRFEEYDRRRPFVAWAWTIFIAKSRIIDYYRRRKAQRVVFSDQLLDQIAQTHLALARLNPCRPSAHP